MGEVLELFHDETRDIVISVGSDGLFKAWNLIQGSFDTCPNISCYFYQTFQYDSSCPPCFAICKNAGKFAVSYYGSLIIFDYINQKSIYCLVLTLAFAPDQYIKDSMLNITHLARLDSMSIWATASVDGCVRIRSDDGYIIRFDILSSF